MLELQEITMKILYMYSTFADLLSVAERAAPRKRDGSSSARYSVR